MAKPSAPAGSARSLSAGLFGAPDAVQQAIGHLNAGRIAEADRKARDILALNPDDPSALKVLGCVAFAQGRGSEAILLLERARTLRPRDGAIHFYLGEASRLTDSDEAAVRHYKKALKINPEFAEAHGNMGDALRATGRFADAAEAYRKALKKRPDLPGSHAGLGHLAVRMGDFAQAARHFEAALRHVPAADAPARASLLINIGSARIDAGAGPEGLAALSEAARGAPDNAQAWRLLAHNLLNVRVIPADPQFRAALLALFGRPDVNPRTLATAAVAALTSDAAVAALLDEIARFPGEADDVIQRHRTAFDALIADSLFRALLTSAPIPDVGIELLLTHVRRALLLDTASQNAGDLAFVVALARQCFLNEYVNFVADDETAALATLRAALDRADFGSRDEDWGTLARLACYEALMGTRAAALNLVGAPDAIAVLLREQIEEPRQERALAAEIKTLKPVQDAVSLAVQSQYEENPYPRWTRCQRGEPRPLAEAVRVFLPHLRDEQLPTTASPRILIAGCGTGLQTMNVVTSYRDAAVLAVDLSRTSLAYGMRKLAEYGIDNVRHLQADILDLGLLDERFDLIESFGVVHHMRDPEAGARVLAGLLAPGGLMLLGLYSAIGRGSVVAVRQVIAQRGYPATPAGIRAARRDLMTGTITPELAPLISPASDFWTTSDCRDMIFHVEEHRFTLIDIETMFGRLELEFVGLELQQPADRRRFAAEHPRRDAQLSLAAWHAFETRHPLTFGDTYRLWARRRG